MIKVTDVSFKYKNSENKVLENLNFTINDGEIVAIVGKNGSGKSTIGKLLSGITKLKSGNILIDDLDISNSKNSKIIRNKMGIVFQNPENQIIFNNVYDEFSFSLNSLEKDEINQRIDVALEPVGMSDFKNCDLYSLSLGQKQRMVIAEVLTKKPKYIILDEPTSMLDGKAKEMIYKVIINLKSCGYTVICITNLADEILLADRTLFLHEGKIAYELQKKDLINSDFVFEKLDIKIPLMLEILTSLKKNNIFLNLDDFSVNSFVNCLKEILK